MVPNHARYQTALHPENRLYFILFFSFLQAFYLKIFFRSFLILFFSLKNKKIDIDGV